MKTTNTTIKTMKTNIRSSLLFSVVLGAALALVAVTLASRGSDAPAVLSRVVGKHCESGDIVVKDEFLPGDVRAGDLVAVPATGAYCRSLSSNYNHVPRPAVVSVRDGVPRVIVRRATEADLLRLAVE